MYKGKKGVSRHFSDNLFNAKERSRLNHNAKKKAQTKIPVTYMTYFQTDAESLKHQTAQNEGVYCA